MIKDLVLILALPIDRPHDRPEIGHTLAGRVLGPKLVIAGVLAYGIVYRFFM